MNFRFDYKYEFDYEYEIETSRFDYEYEFDFEYDFDCEYDFLVRLFGTTKFLIGVHKIVVGSTLAAVLLFTTRITEDPVVSITSSKAKK